MAVIFFKSYFWTLTFAFFFFLGILHWFCVWLQLFLIPIWFPSFLFPTVSRAFQTTMFSPMTWIPCWFWVVLTTLNPIYWCARFVNPSLVNFKYTFLDHKEILWFQLCCKCLSNKLVSFNLINVTYSSLPLLHFHTWMYIKSLLLGLMT